MKARFSGGFTLSELLLAAVILLVVVSGLLVTFTYSLLLNESNHNLIVAVVDAQYVLEQIKGLAYGNIGSYSPPSLANLQDETITLTRTIGAKIAEITVDVGWTERQRARSIQLTTRIAN